ncbi:MAG: 1-acyl-sn-glycerol-3-phosphate acyltransferase [Bacteroidaceae bacterium]|nr:1-acyl-sn-glycerol-3-phosphate acyltransferase [Bacteroidaceae bacterium]MBP5348030.1 1-acyl-sn-glycerol-3-phosphate acyltransferase [Bacteroidaceae bacterium]
MSKHIQDSSRFYSFLKIFVDWSVKSSYRKYQVEGIENLPKDGYSIWAANHTNALMDPMVMLSTSKQPKVFVARADIFKKKNVVKILSFLKVMPIYRIRDGIEAVKHNNESIEIATNVILDHVPFVIYPEATHRPKHSLLKLSKGIFHIAESVIEKAKDGKPVYIQPIGIEYGDYFRFRSTVLIRFGKPFNITEYLNEHSDQPQPVTMLNMREVLTRKLAELIVYIPDDEDYDAVWEYVKLRSGNPEYFKKAIADIEQRDGSKLKGLLRIQAVDKYAVQEALDLKESNPDAAKNLFKKVDTLRLWRIQNGVSARSIANECGAFKLFVKFLLALIGLPYYCFCAIASSIKWIPITLVLRTVKDDAFYNTARFGTRMALALLALPIWAVVYYLFLPWQIATAAFLLSLPSLRYLYDYGCYFRCMCSDIRWKFKKRRAPKLEF